MFNDEEALAEVARMAAEAQGTSWSAGRGIYKQAVFCLNPARLWHPDADRLLDDYRLSQALGIPVAATLEGVPALYADAVLVIQHELAHIRKALGEHAHG